MRSLSTTKLSIIKLCCALTVALCSGACQTEPLQRDGSSNGPDGSSNNQQNNNSNNNTNNNNNTEPQVPRPDVTVMPHGDVSEPVVAIAGRRGHRLSVDQLRRIVPQLFGMQWEDANGRNLFDLNALSLGEADYINMTEDVREPGSLFAKTMDDMAGRICREVALRDASAEEANRQLIRYPDDVDQNLRWLKLKFHGIYVPEGCDDGIKPLRELYEQVNAACAASPSGNSGDGCPRRWPQAYRGLDAGWVATCVALITDPELMVY